MRREAGAGGTRIRLSGVVVAPGLTAPTPAIVVAPIMMQPFPPEPPGAQPQLIRGGAPPLPPSACTRPLTVTLGAWSSIAPPEPPPPPPPLPVVPPAPPFARIDPLTVIDTFEVRMISPPPPPPPPPPSLLDASIALSMSPP